MNHRDPGPSRSAFLLGGAAAAFAAALAPPARAAGPGAGVGAEEALARLMRGNRAYVHEMAGSRLNTLEERAALGSGQAPWASILTCSDSRTAPEILFNVGLGDIFVTRVAGNVAGSDEVASLEYGAAVLGSQLIVVMGHSGCGAVHAAIDFSEGKTMASDDLARLMTALQPAVERAKEMHGDHFVNAVKANAVIVASNLKGNALLKGLLDRHELSIVAAYCDLSTGAVSLL